MDMKNITATLALVFLASACYSSSHGTEDTGIDPTTDTTPDPQVDPVVDPLPDPVDVPVDTPLEPDVPPPPQFSVTFVIENASPPECSSCVYYLEYMYYFSQSYGLGITWNGRDIQWETPFCTVGCEGLTDPMYCCIDCAAPMPAVQQIVPGQSVSVTWYGDIFTIDSELCDCGCYWRNAAPPGRGTVRVCAYTSYSCYMGDECTVNDEGIIPMAEAAGDALCTEADFSFPADDGREVFLRIQ
jgi:hypothetical protein